MCKIDTDLSTSLRFAQGDNCLVQSCKNWVARFERHPVFANITL